MKKELFPELFTRLPFRADGGIITKAIRGAIPDSFVPNLFTLYALQAFAAFEGTKRFYEALRRFSGYGST